LLEGLLITGGNDVSPFKNDIYIETFLVIEKQMEKWQIVKPAPAAKI